MYNDTLDTYKTHELLYNIRIEVDMRVKETRYVTVKCSVRTFAHLTIRHKREEHAVLKS